MLYMVIEVAGIEVSDRQDVENFRHARAGAHSKTSHQIAAFAGDV
ncbi:hypothetical protein [uncultured Arthrobacter sp.]|nr:hypothetical protein [uncultured Arthrobacter sp.]